ncbi:hypothetical protein BC358_20970 [Hydrogenophaga sp. H7]|nr:hypothetical protein BC358_20970 [Hydrogenophaga sp. H7]
MGAYRIEISKTYDPEGWARCADIPQHVLDVQLAAPVSIDDMLGMRFVYRKILRITVDGGAATEHQMGN